MLRVECQDEERIRVIDPGSLPCQDLDFTIPMQFSKQTWLESMYNEEKSELKTVLDDFVKMFDASTLKITEGSAQNRFGSTSLLDRVTDACATNLHLTKTKLFTEASAAVGNNRMASVMGASFGISCGAIGPAKNELEDSACFRLNLKGDVSLHGK